MHKSDPTLNEKANLDYFFDINEDVFHDDDTSIIDGHISILTPVISTENVVDRDDESDLFQNELSTITDIGVTDESNDSLFSPEVSVHNYLPAGDSVELVKLDSVFENGIEDSVQYH